MVKTIFKALGVIVLMALVSTATASKSEQWLTDMDQAQKIAKAEGKDIFMFFTGSDWCAYCIKLDDEVLSKSEFLSYAKDHLVLVDLDFPAGEDIITEEQRDHNEQWQDRFQINAYPTVILADDNATRYAISSGYREGGPEKYVEYLKTLKANKDKRDSLLVKAATALGVNRAKLLDEALSLEGIYIENHQELRAEVLELSQADEALQSKTISERGNASLRDELYTLSKRKLPDKESLQSHLELFEKYNFLKNGSALERLLHSIDVFYRANEQPRVAQSFSENIFSDESYSISIRQKRGIHLAKNVARLDGAAAAIAILDKAIALDPDSKDAEDRDYLVQLFIKIASEEEK